MTDTPNSGPEGQQLLYNSDDVEYKQSAKPAKTQFKITVKPTAARRSSLDLPIYESEVQKAIRQLENNPIVRLQRQLENNPIFQVQRMMDSAFPSIPESLLELERLQRSMRAFDSYRL